MSEVQHFHIRIDDQDREHAPDRPWTANLYHGAEWSRLEPAGVGIGASPAEALRDLLADPSTAWTDEEEDLAAEAVRSPFPTNAHGNPHVNAPFEAP